MRLLPLTMLMTALFASHAMAALKTGDKAPDFEAKASLAGKEIHFKLSEALKKGPVVLYFYPAAFTKGCTVEAHEFAEATDEFQKLGATVIGMSGDDLDTLHKFSVSECRNKFAVAADPSQKIIKAYDAVLSAKPEYADRISYVIAPSGEVIHVHAAMDPHGHISESLAAVKQWAEGHPRKSE